MVDGGDDGNDDTGGGDTMFLMERKYGEMSDCGAGGVMTIMINKMQTRAIIKLMDDRTMAVKMLMPMPRR